MNSDQDENLLNEFQELWRDADALWNANQHEPAFRRYVAADYFAVCPQLAALKGQVRSVLEWGSGLGVVTIMASALGFEAVGIEAERELVDFSTGLARKYQSGAQFFEGNFIPSEFNEAVQNTRTNFAGTPAYKTLGRTLADFDLVYAFPWPEEHAIYSRVLAAHGKPEALFLTYDVNAGASLCPNEVITTNQ